MEDGQSRYEMLEEIGRGGMGTVYKARDRKLDRIVAMKRIHPSLSSDTLAVGRLQREARVAAALEHPNIVHIYDVLRDEEGVTIAMEHVPGESLADRIDKHGPLQPALALAICRKVGEALAAAHRENVLHLDVKPSNVLLSERGEPKLTDFGIAVWQSDLGEMTRELVGTPEYAAPEQADTNRQPDAQADVYALAAMLYACLTGENPRVIRESNIPSGFRRILLKALARKPEERHYSMEAFLAELQRVNLSSGKSRGWLAAAILAISVIFAVGAYFVYEDSGEESAELTVASVGPESDSRESVVPQAASDQVPAPPKIAAELERVWVYKTVTSHGYALGFVKNTGEAPIENPRVDMEFFDAQGKSLVQAFAFGTFDLLEPGMRAPVKVLLEPYPEGYDRYNAEVEARGLYIPSSRLAKLTVLKKEFERGKVGSDRLRARIRNDDKMAVRFAKVVAIFYDDKDQVIEVASGYAKDRKLEPGDESDVDVVVHPLGGADPARFELFALATVR
jgi:tRNA A-37 threonylcarbamoyl transferase component Bud32